MKTKTVIYYIIIAAILYTIIYYAYKNYKASGSIFKSSPDILGSDTTNSASRFSVNIKHLPEKSQAAICIDSGGSWVGLPRGCVYGGGGGISGHNA